MFANIIYRIINTIIAIFFAGVIHKSTLLNNY